MHSSESDWRELASRENNGLAITLVWSKVTDQVKVMVVEAELEREFELNVDGVDALEAFYHPFAYEARRSDTEAARRESLDLQPQS
jgi:hypothetical protein